MEAIFITLLSALFVTANSTTSVSTADFDKGRECADVGNFTCALEEWQPLADQGHARAQYRLARLYANGNGVDKDLTEAIRLYHLAVDQGDADAQLGLGYIYETGNGTAKDEIAAVRGEVLFQLTDKENWYEVYYPYYPSGHVLGYVEGFLVTQGSSSE